MWGLYQVLSVLLCLGILITIHEFGHYLVARWCNVKVLCFSVGFGRTLWSVRRGPDDTEYRIALIPLGGYVRMQDDRHDPLPSQSERARAFNRQPPARRAAIAVAGPLANFLLAILVFWGAYLVGIESTAPVVGKVEAGSVAERHGIVPGDRIVRVDGRPNRTWNEHGSYLLNRSLSGATVVIGLRAADGVERETAVDLSQTPERDALSPVLQSKLGMSPWLPPWPAVIAEVTQDSAAATAGLAAGDRIVALDGVAIGGWRQLAAYIGARPGTAVLLDFERDGLRRQVVATPEAVTDGDTVSGRLGIRAAPLSQVPGLVVRARHGPLDGLWAAVRLSGEMSWLTARVVWRLATLQLPSRHLSGPLSIADYTGRAARAGIDQLLVVLGLVSIGIAIFNLLPVPLLDGGHLLFCLIEVLRGSPVTNRGYAIGGVIGAAVLAGVMGLAIYNDILSYFIAGVTAP